MLGISLLTVCYHLKSIKIRKGNNFFPYTQNAKRASNYRKWRTLKYIKQGKFKRGTIKRIKVKSSWILKASMKRESKGLPKRELTIQGKIFNQVSHRI